MSRLCAFACALVCAVGCGYEPRAKTPDVQENPKAPTIVSDPEVASQLGQLATSIGRQTDALVSISRDGAQQMNAIRQVIRSRQLATADAPVRLVADPITPNPPQPFPPPAPPAAPDPVPRVAPRAGPQYGSFTGTIAWGDPRRCEPCRDQRGDLAARGPDLGYTVGNGPDSDIWLRTPTGAMATRLEYEGEPLCEFVTSGTVVGTKTGYERGSGDLSEIFQRTAQAIEGRSSRPDRASVASRNGGFSTSGYSDDYNRPRLADARGGPDSSGRMPFGGETLSADASGYLGRDDAWHSWSDGSGVPVARFVDHTAAARARYRATGSTYDCSMSRARYFLMPASYGCGQPYSAPNCGGGFAFSGDCGQPNPTPWQYNASQWTAGGWSTPSYSSTYTYSSGGGYCANGVCFGR